MTTGYLYQHGDRPLEGYAIQHALGRGGFGEVYYALSDSGREVALKALNGYEQIELRGASQCMNLKSPHLVTIFDIRHNEQGKTFVIMEYVAGPSLRDVLDEHPAGLGTAKSAFFLREMAKGLTYLHDCGIVHRDLKPANIFYENGYVKIGDYGLSKAICPGVHSTQTITVGTVHYMAPEVGAGCYDRSIDLYALGCVLYEMLTGQAPYVGASHAEILMKHMMAEPDVTGMDSTMARVVRRALAKDPQQRYQTAQEMVEDIFGAEHVRNCVSTFSPDSLSSAGERVGRQLVDRRPPVVRTNIDNSGIVSLRTPTPVTPPPPPAPARRPSPDAPKVAAAAASPAPPVASPVRGDVHPLTDPMGGGARFLLAVLGAGIVAATVNALYWQESVGGRTWFYILTGCMQVMVPILGGVLALRYTRHRMPMQGESMGFQRLVYAAMVAMGMLLPLAVLHVLHFMPLHGYSVLPAAAAVLLLDWRKRSEPGRKERVHLRAALGAGVVGLVAAFVLKGSPELTVGIVAGISLAGQALCPWYTRDARVARQVSELRRRRTPSPATRVWSLLAASAGFFGVCGLQRFYVGKHYTGLLYLLTFGLLGVGQLLDVILILAGAFRDAEDRPVIAWLDLTEIIDDSPSPVHMPPAIQGGERSDETDAAGPPAGGPEAETLPRRPQTVSRAAVAGVILLLAGLFLGLSLAVDVPGLAVAGHLGPQVRHLVSPFRQPSRLAEELAPLAGLLLVGASVLLWSSRWNTPGWHGVRAALAPVLIGIALVSLRTTGFADGAFTQAVSADSPPQAMDILQRAADPGGLARLGLLVLLGVVLLIWPARRSPVQMTSSTRTEGGS